jgi:hypothetical protein
VARVAKNLELLLYVCRVPYPTMATEIYTQLQDWLGTSQLPLQHMLFDKQPYPGAMQFGGVQKPTTFGMNSDQSVPAFIWPGAQAPPPQGEGLSVRQISKPPQLAAGMHTAFTPSGPIFVNDRQHLFPLGQALESSQSSSLAVFDAHAPTVPQVGSYS